jgi:hypothetical protein
MTTTPNTPEERRIAAQLIAYWNDLRGTRPFPSAQQIDPNALATIWDHCFIITTTDDAHQYQHLGSAIRAAYCGDSMDCERHAMIGADTALLAPSLSLVHEHQSPIEEDGEFQSLDGKTVQFRQCLLPLSGKDGTIDAIFGGMSLRVV